MGSFSLKGGVGGFIGRLEAGISIAEKELDESIQKKVNAATQIVYMTARARRPKITKEEQKALGRNVKSYRVSDPDASAGVPVKTGDLQLSIKKETFLRNGKWVGRIYIDGPGQPYAEYIEFGTSRMRARPFMRPAVHLNIDWIKRKFAEKE